MKAFPTTAATSGGPTAAASPLMSCDLLIGKVCAPRLLLGSSRERGTLDSIGDVEKGDPFDLKTLVHTPRQIARTDPPPSRPTRRGGWSLHGYPAVPWQVDPAGRRGPAVGVVRSKPLGGCHWQVPGPERHHQ